MTNHSKTEVYRLQWPEHANLKFSPTLAHLHPDHTKDITVTFKSDAAKVLTETAINCKVTKIKYDKPIDQVGRYNLLYNTVIYIVCIIHMQAMFLSTVPLRKDQFYLNLHVKTSNTTQVDIKSFQLLIVIEV